MQEAARKHNLHCPLDLDRAEQHETPFQSLIEPRRAEIAASLVRFYPAHYRKHL